MQITPIDSVRHLFPADRCNRIFLVGGCVRDLLLPRSISDIDLISTLTPDEMAASGFRLVTGKSTAPIWFRHDAVLGSIEVTLIPNMYELDDDLARRDFTINAMAMSVDGEVIDPLNGRTALEQRLLRACSSQTFIADPLRIFRALRFETDGWKLDHDTEQLIREHDWSDSWTAIPVERFSREMLKSLHMGKPERFFQRMLELETGQTYLPEIFCMPHIPAGPLIHHPEGDLFTHSIQVLQRVAGVCCDPLTRFCALFHDIGKLATSPALYPKHHGHDQAGFTMALEFCQRLRLPTPYGVALAWISRLHGTFNLWDQLRDATKLKIAAQAIKAGIVDVLPLVAAADKAGGSRPEAWRAVVEIAGMSATTLGIDPHNLEVVRPEKRPEYIQRVQLEKLHLIQTSSS
jgi:tRNA nucleotidyltransferase (CCA-adding enzyme)